MTLIPLLASISGAFADTVSRDGLLGVAVLMAIDAVLPVGGGIVMLVAGALAAGVFTDHHPTLFGLQLGIGLGAYIALALAGTFGSLAGALVGWLIGRRGGRRFVERWGNRLHLGSANLVRAEGWFARHGERAVFLGRLIPVVRSFISIPAGFLGSPMKSYVLLTTAGSAIWSFVVAGVGWALGAGYDSANGVFRAIEISGLVVVVLAGGTYVLKRRMVRRGSG